MSHQSPSGKNFWASVHTVAVRVATIDSLNIMRIERQVQSRAYSYLRSNRGVAVVLQPTARGIRA